MHILYFTAKVSWQLSYSVIYMFLLAQLGLGTFGTVQSVHYGLKHKYQWEYVLANKHNRSLQGFKDEPIPLYVCKCA